MRCCRCGRGYDPAMFGADGVLSVLWIEGLCPTCARGDADER
jgi:hypothetical protein